MGKEVTAKTSPVTAKLISPTAAGVIAKGAITVSFFNTGVNNVTVAGGTLGAGLSVTFPEIDGAVYREIEYDPGTSTLLISESR